jgi:hypothetical protein
VALRLQALALCAVSLLACKKEEAPAASTPPSATPPAPAAPTPAAPTPAAPTPAAPPTEPTPAPAAAAPAAARASGLVAREDGVGPLGANLVIKKMKLAMMFPGFAVKRVSIPHGGDLREDYWGISKAGKLLLRVHTAGSTLSAVDIVSNDVANPFGIAIGQRYAEVNKAIGPLDCENGGDATDWRANIVVCTFKSPSYSLDFAYNDDRIYDAKEMLGAPAKLAKAKLVAITWEPPKGPR